MQSFWHRVFRTNSMNAIVPKKCAPIRLVKLMPNAGQWDMHGKCFWVLGVSMSATSLLSFISLFSSQKHLQCLGSRLVDLPQGSDTEATRVWTEGKPWEIAWGELRGEGARWKRRQGGRTGNSATTCWTSEIAWGELRWEGAKRKQRQGGPRGNCGK